MERSGRSGVVPFAFRLESQSKKKQPRPRWETGSALRGGVGVGVGVGVGFLWSGGSGSRREGRVTLLSRDGSATTRVSFSVGALWGRGRRLKALDVSFPWGMRVWGGV